MDPDELGRRIANETGVTIRRLPAAHIRPMNRTTSSRSLADFKTNYWISLVYLIFMDQEVVLV